MIEEILRRIDSFRALNLKDPVGVYLGYEEIRDLCADTRPRYHYYRILGAKRNEVDGIPIYEVDEPRHFNVG